MLTLPGHVEDVTTIFFNISWSTTIMLGLMLQSRNAKKQNENVIAMLPVE